MGKNGESLTEANEGNEGEKRAGVPDFLPFRIRADPRSAVAPSCSSCNSCRKHSHALFFAFPSFWSKILGVPALGLYRSPIHVPILLILAKKNAFLPA
jgi:hypothetical protein